MNSIKKYVGVALISGLVLAATGCKEKEENKETAVVEQERVELVSVSPLQKETISKSISISTVLQPYETMNISPSVTGAIRKINVDVASRVNKGQLLVMMDETQVKTTRLQFANLQTELNRVEALLKSGSISQQVYDQTKVQYDLTKENLDFLEKNTYVKAEFSGVISAKNFEEGELYSGMPILTLIKINTLKALVNIPEAYFPLVKAGKKVKLTSDIYEGRNFEGVIETIYPTIDANTHTFQAKVKIANAKEELRPGMYMSVEIDLDNVDAIIVPYQSVLKLQGANERYVFVNNEGYAKRVVVTLGKRFDDKIEVMSDELKEGDELITVGQAKLVDGVKLNISK
ncbi:MAG: efflux RND transporter periplasmic adaptor subunit [Bacteroidales bacterium]|nr:efflux RND transporter periplasmic adaptor subunit [Bacteroidales bacterium]